MLAAGAVALPMSADAAPRSARVDLKDYRFSKPRVTIARGGSVTWTWRDDAQHNVTSVGSKHFRSSTTKATGTYRVRFTKPGTYRYECSIHASFMKGTVVVK